MSSTPEGSGSPRHELALRPLLERLDDLEPEQEKALLLKLLDRAKRLEVADLWLASGPALTHWILLLTGPNQEQEIEIAKELLSWQTFLAKHSARVLCIPSSEREPFICCAKQFDAQTFPCLYISDSPTMRNPVSIDGQTLRTLQEQGQMQAFLTQMHSQLERGKPLKEVQLRLLGSKVAKAIKFAYAEAKGVFSINISTDV